MPRIGKNGARTLPPAPAARKSKRSKRAVAGGPRRQLKKKKNRAKAPTARVMHLFDPNHTSHLPLPSMVTPYVVQRFIINETVITHASQKTYLVIMPNGLAGGSFGAAGAYTGVIALKGHDTTLVKSMSQILLPDLDSIAVGPGFGGTGPEIAVSAMSASVACVTSAFNGAGSVWMGRSNAPIENWGQVSATASTTFSSFTVRQDVRPMTYYQLLQPHKVIALPMDFVSYESFLPVYKQPDASGLSLNTTVNAMTPIIIVFGPTDSSGFVSGGGVVYNVRIAVEARVRYPVADARYSLHQRHTPTPHGVFNGLVASAEAAIGGVVAEAEGAAEAAARAAVAGAVHRVTRGVLG